MGRRRREQGKEGKRKEGEEENRRMRGREGRRCPTSWEEGLLFCQEACDQILITDRCGGGGVLNTRSRWPPGCLGLRIVVIFPSSASIYPLPQPRHPTGSSFSCYSAVTAVSGDQFLPGGKQYGHQSCNSTRIYWPGSKSFMSADVRRDGRQRRGTSEGGQRRGGREPQGNRALLALLTSSSGCGCYCPCQLMQTTMAWFSSLTAARPGEVISGHQVSSTHRLFYDHVTPSRHTCAIFVP